MHDKIRQVLSELTRLEDELEGLMEEEKEEVLYHIEGSRVRFEESIAEAQRRLRVGLFTWLRQSRPRNLASAPFIYGMIVPFVFFDICLAIYQAICFPLYRIPKVRRSDYIVIDRQHLQFLNSIEKINCMYCGYGNGLLAYAREITARTEQYWCPIKHARKVLGSHRRYIRFLEYGDAEDYHEKLMRYREALGQEAGQDQPGPKTV